MINIDSNHDLRYTTTIGHRYIDYKQIINIKHCSMILVDLRVRVENEPYNFLSNVNNQLTLVVEWLECCSDRSQICSSPYFDVFGSTKVFNIVVSDSKTFELTKQIVLNSALTQFLSVDSIIMALRFIKRTYNRMFLAKDPMPPYASHVVQIGDPVLRNKASPVPLEKIGTKEVQNLIYIMKSLMKKSNLIGLAAPQVGVPFQIFVIHFPHPSHYFSKEEIILKGMEHVENQVWINPELKVLNHEKVTFNESCASFKGYSADVPRYKRVLLTGIDENGEKKTLDANEWTARIVQHEMDHLNGVMYSDRMVLNSLCCTGWHTINQFQGFVELRYEN